MKNNNIIQEIDYRRIKKIEEIREKYFNELPDGKDGAPISSFLIDLGLILFFGSFIFNFLVLVSKNAMFIDLFIEDGWFWYILFFSIFIILFGIVIQGKEKMKRVKKVEGVDLSVDFFVNKLKGTDLEISREDYKAYKIFLDRYIRYVVLKDVDSLDYSPTKYFNKKYVSSLTIEELFVSAFIFPSYRDFIYIDTSGGD